MAAYINEHGRKPGRGIRPWLLIPKVIGVALYAGGVSAAAALAWLHPSDTVEQARLMAESVRIVMVYCAVPGLLLAILMGLGLFWQHPKVFASMRWWKIKMAILLIGIPLLHFYTRGVVQNLRINPSGVVFGLYVDRLRYLLTVASAMMALVIFLGRHKPRLGQPITTVAQQKQSKEIGMKRIGMICLLSLLGLWACSSTQPQKATLPAAVAAAAYPAPLTIEIRSMGDSRKVMYRLEPDGELFYGGGRDAVLGEPPSVGTLKPEQILPIWKLIQDRQLMNASGAGLFTKAEKVKYTVKLRAGGQTNSFDAVDDKTPGVAELDQMLFKLAGDLRYNSVFKPIDEQIKKSGGAVKQQK